MRILFTSHYALPHLGGIEVAIDAIARELGRRGHEVVHVASTARRRDQHDGAPPSGYRVERVPALNGLEERLEVPWPLFSPALARVLRRELRRADVVHAHGFLYLPTPLALALARRVPGRPLRVLTEHVGRVGYGGRALDVAERGAIASLGRVGTRLAEGLVVLNEKVRAELRRLAPRTPIELILNGVDPDRYRPAGEAERLALRERLGWDERPRALFVGRLVARKGIELAAAGAAEAGVELVVAGPGTAPVGGAGLQVLGPQPPERVAELYRAADALVLPSRGEGFPVTAQEALASGLPVVLSDDPNYRPYVGGADDVVRLVAPSAAGVAAALRDLPRDAAARRAMADRAAAHARERFSWVRAADEHLALYERLRARRG